MKKFVLMFAVLMGSCNLMLAQTSATDSTKSSTEAINQIDDNSTMNAMNDSSQAAAQQDTVTTPQDAATPAPTPQPVDDSGPNLLVMGVLTLCGIIGLILGIVAILKVKKAKEERNEEIAALKTALQHRKAEHDEEIKRLQMRIAALESNMAQATPAPRQGNQITKKVAEPIPEIPVTAPVQLYLTRPNERGYFIAESARMERGNSIFVLTTTDGTHGTYRVIDDRGVHQLALMMPTENLTRACVGDGIQVSNGKSRIVTDQPGTAVKEGGQWRIVNPAEIHYEA